jgi:hypothetical protein
MHARFPFFVLSIVSCVVRAQLGKPAGRIFYVHELEPLPGRLPGRPSIVHEPGRPSCGRCASVVRCNGMPGRARARRGSCDASRAQLCAVVHGRRLQAPTGSRVAYGHTTAVGTIRTCGRLLCGRGRTASPIDHVHERRPAQLGRRRMRALGQRLALKIGEVFQLVG